MPSPISANKINGQMTMKLPSPNALVAALAAAAPLTLVLTTPAEAHVKWFAPYIVEAPPQRLALTIANPWFWTGIGLVLTFFIATRWIELATPNADCDGSARRRSRSSRSRSHHARFAFIAGGLHVHGACSV